MQPTSEAQKLEKGTELKMREMDRNCVGRTLGLALGVAALAAGSCSKDVEGFSTEEWSRVKLIEPLSTAMPANPYDDRADDDEVAKLGQKLFFEKELAEGITVAGPSGAMGETGKVGCVTCHDTKYFTDSRPFPQSHGRTWLSHNTPSMVNLGWFKWTLWTGTFDSLMAHGAGAWGTSATPLVQAHFLYRKYRDEYNRLFPETPLDPALDPTAPDAARFPATGGAKANAAAADGPFEKMTKADQWKIHQIRANLAKIFDAYPRKLVTRNSAFEKYVKGTDRSEASFSNRAKNGLKLFIGKASCIDCHNGPLLS
ncbi:MAG: cytochrome c peroxidase, partial [Bacteroidota bacterium]